MKEVEFNVFIKLSSYPLQSEKTTTLTVNPQELILLCNMINKLSYLADYANDLVIQIEKIEEVK
jgi:hypothetical protein